jgi:hypothetical protein
MYFLTLFLITFLWLLFRLVWFGSVRFGSVRFRFVLILFYFILFEMKENIVHIKSTNIYISVPTLNIQVGARTPRQKCSLR